LINFVDATNDANHYTKPPPKILISHADVQLHELTVWLGQ